MTEANNTAKPQAYFGDMILKQGSDALMDFRFLLTVELLKQGHALIAARPDGEDSAGRQKLRSATPQELVAFAIECATLAVNEAEAREWIKPLPEEKEMWAKAGHMTAIRDEAQRQAELHFIDQRVKAKKASAENETNA